MNKYSVAIRSVANNPLLEQTLTSLEAQTCLPAEIVIAIPEDVLPWDTGYSMVRFVMAERGMVSQRAAGIRTAVNPIVLALDDDIVLSPDVSERMLRAIDDQRADCVVPYCEGILPKGKLLRAIDAIFGIAVPRKGGGISYTSSGGYYYPTSSPGNQPVITEGGAGAVILVRTAFLAEHNCFGELALQRISHYALRDDGDFILSIHRSGGKCIMVGGVNFAHLEGTTRLSPDKYYVRFKALAYNQFIFWRKHFWRASNLSIWDRTRNLGSFLWYCVGIFVLSCLMSIKLRTWHPVMGCFVGWIALASNKFK